MKQISFDVSFVFVLVLLCLLFIVFGPLIQIWAVNTLFKTNIEFSLLNWFCVILLNSSINAASYKGK